MTNRPLASRPCAPARTGRPYRPLQAKAPAANPARGFLAGVAAYTVWGLFPLYWKGLEALAADEILSHRIVWSLAFVLVLLTVTRGWAAVRATFRSPRVLYWSLASGALIATNWFVYIWAVVHDRVVEASLGYYLTPLANVALGAAFLRERLRPWQWASVALAGLGVVFSTAGYGRFPAIALTLCVSFSLYGLCRKLSPSGPLLGLFFETALLSPFAAGLIGWRCAHGLGGFGRTGIVVDSLLLGGGVVTALPLLWFATAARNLSMTTLGLLQYLAPSVMFGLSLFLYHEPFTPARAVTFGCIWAALALYTAEGLWQQRRVPSQAGLRSAAAAGPRVAAAPR